VYFVIINFVRRNSFESYTTQAYELAGRFYLDIGDRALSFEHFRLAHETYIAWGAVGKASCLFEYINSAFEFASAQHAT
jgi:hypothetical protein